MNKLLLVSIIISILLFSMFVVFYTNTVVAKKDSVQTTFPPDTLESCQKQRAILMDGIKELEDRLNANS